MTTKTSGKTVAAGNVKVRVISESEFEGNSVTHYRDVLTYCAEHLGRAVEWPAESTLDHTEATRIQNGFHSSGMGRQLRPTHNIVTSVVERDGGWKVQVKVNEKTKQEKEAEALKLRLATKKK